MKKPIYLALMAALALCLSAANVNAQQMKHRNVNKGSNKSSISGRAARSDKRPKANRQARSKPATRKPASRPNTSGRDLKRQGSNGGSSSSGRKPTNNRRLAAGDNKQIKNSGNNVGIKGGDKNINVNVDNSRDIKINNNVRVNNRQNNRYYNGRRGYQPYYYHPYRPYSYGPRWHPFGFFVTTMAVTAIIVSNNNQDYHYDNGVYTQSSKGYTVVNPPTNIVVNTLPDGAENVILDGEEFLYFGGAFYIKENGKYRVIDAPDGAVVTNIPEGAQEEEIGGENFVVYNYTYFKPFSQDGKDMYQVVTMEAT